VLGLRPHWYKLQAFVLSSALAAAGGIVYMLLYSGSTLAVTQPSRNENAGTLSPNRRPV